MYLLWMEANQQLNLQGFTETLTKLFQLTVGAKKDIVKPNSTAYNFLLLNVHFGCWFHISRSKTKVSLFFLEKILKLLCGCGFVYLVKTVNKLQLTLFTSRTCTKPAFIAIKTFTLKFHTCNMNCCAS